MRLFHFITSLFLLSVLNCQNTFSQNTGIGASAIYNLQTRSIGIEARAEYPLEQFYLLEGLTFAPQISYFPGFNKVHEFYLGSSIHLGIYTIKKWRIYGLANIAYNGWINHKDSKSERAKFSNIGFDLGGGITGTTCLRPFFEYRYNVYWQEANLRLGIIYTLKCDKRGMVPCPKIPDSPQF